MTGDQQPLELTNNRHQRLDVGLALQAARLGVWEVDLITNQVLLNQRCCQLLGLARDNPMTYQQYSQLIHPQDVSRVEQAMQWAINPQSDGTFDQTYRIIRADDRTQRWVRFWGQRYLTPAGELYCFSGVAQEVTQDLASQQELEKNKAHFHNLVQQTPAPTLVLRGDGYIIEQANPPMLAFMDRGEEVIGQPLLSIMPELAGQSVWQQLQRVYQEGVDFDQNEVLVSHVRQGVLENIFYNLSYRPLREGGQIAGVIQVVTDVTKEVLIQ